MDRIGGGKTTKLARVPYAVKGKNLELALPRSLFGTAPRLRFDFRWGDNQQKDRDMLEFALKGDSAPDRCFNYRYDQTVTEAAIRSSEKAANPGRKTKGR